MTGYPGKSRSLSWSHDGKFLATSGAEACILWPFADKDGPMGKAPRECGVRPARVTAVACHPKALVTSIGYDDGCVLMCRLTDGAELLVRRASAFAGAISALAWDDAGARLAFGTRRAPRAGSICRLCAEAPFLRGVPRQRGHTCSRRERGYRAATAFEIWLILMSIRGACPARSTKPSLR